MNPKTYTVDSVNIPPNEDDNLFGSKIKEYEKEELNVSEGVESENEFDWDYSHTEDGF